MITKFKYFLLEYNKMRDNIIFKTTKNTNTDNVKIISDIEKNINRVFENDESLVYKIHLDDKDMNLKFKYYDTEDHRIKTKIKNRTTLKSVSEFNNLFIKTIKSVIPEQVRYDGEIDKKGCYAFYLTENRFYILINIDPYSLMTGNLIINNKITKQDYHLYVVTVHNESSLGNYYKIVNIDDSDF